MTHERCDEISGQLEALERRMLTKADIPLITQSVADEVDQIYAARFGRASARVVVYLFGAAGAGVLTWLAAHGYIDGGAR